MAGLQGVIGSGGRIRTSDLWVMSVIRSKTISLEIPRTYGNPKALRPRAAATHGTHGTRVFHLVMYRMMYIFRVSTFGVATRRIGVSATEHDTNTDFSEPSAGISE